MSGSNLFSRLAGYSQNPRKLSIENFSTELIAHLFNHDSAFRRRFLKVVFNDLRLARAFKRARATTQDSLGRDCRVDIILRAGLRLHLIEVKISATETTSDRWGQIGKPQVQRYIDLGRGHVTYLTTSSSLLPEIDLRGRKFRLEKHALFEELHKSLKGERGSDVLKMFVEFMEKNGMASPRTFERREIRRAGEALDIWACLEKTDTNSGGFDVV